MRRSRVAVAVLAAAIVCLSLPASSLAGTYRWSLPADFASTAPGLNPDHDPYGARPWAYVESDPGSQVSPPSHDPATFLALGTFESSVDGGLAGWTDTGDPTTLIAANPTGSPITNGSDTYPATALTLAPASDRFVAIGWTSPLPNAATVSVNGSVLPEDAGPCLLGTYSWTLDQNGSSIATSAGNASGSIANTVTVQPGGAIYLTVSSAGIYSSACAAVAVSLTISAPSTPPTVTLTSPANGALISGGQPVFSGSATQAFATSGQVAVTIYSGNSTTGSPIETVAANVSNGFYAVSPSSTLSDGLYTAQAAQSNLAGDAALSNATTFRISNAPPAISLNGLGSAPLHITGPTFTGTAGTASGDSAQVVLLVYPGANTTGSPVRLVSGAVNSDGSYAIAVTPALSDGQYTVVAAQSTSGGNVNLSPPVTFRIKVHGPAVMITAPLTGSNVSQTNLSFAGVSGTGLGDTQSIALTLYGGNAAKGRALGSVTVTPSRGSWQTRWPKKLALGIYTLRAVQNDDAGNSSTVTSTFLVVPSPGVIGTSIQLAKNGVVTVPISCAAARGTSCDGYVLIVTRSAYRPVAGGPSGKLRVLFGYFRVPGGSTQIVSRKALAPVLAALRRAKHISVNVTVLTTVGRSRAHVYTAQRLVNISR